MDIEEQITAISECLDDIRGKINPKESSIEQDILKQRLSRLCYAVRTLEEHLDMKKILKRIVL